MKLTRRMALTAAASFAALPVFAQQPAVYAPEGMAIGGYDPVAYFAENGPVKGDAQFTSVHDGATFQFATAENKALFDSDPSAYAPQYGGYCAYAVSRGYTATTVPEAWSIYEGKLYLNFSKSVRALWATNKSGNVEAGDANWPDVLAEG